MSEYTEELTHPHPISESRSDNMKQSHSSHSHAPSKIDTDMPALWSEDQTVDRVDSPRPAERTPSPTTTQGSKTHFTCKDNVGVYTAQKTADGVSNSSQQGLRDVRRPWKQTIIRLGPLSGIFSMAVALASIFASLGILVGSNKADVENWDIQPSIYLAICTAIANQSMRFASWQGVAIAWWTRATRKESTLAQLHFDWRSGTTIRGALTAGRHFSWLGIACIFSTFVAIDGPLLQRASNVVPAEIVQHPTPLQANMAWELPSGFTGDWKYSSDFTQHQFWNETYPSSDGPIPSNVITDVTGNIGLYAVVPWLKGSAMSGFIHGCHGECRAKIKAPALAETSCMSRILSVNYSDPSNVDLDKLFTDDGSLNVLPLDTFAFVTDIGLMVDGRESINLITGFSQTQDCAGIFNLSACTLESAIGEYDVVISNDTVTLLSGVPEIVALAKNTKMSGGDADHKARPSTLAGIVQGGRALWVESLNIFTAGGSLQATGYIGKLSQMYTDPQHPGFDDSCPSFLDPRQDIIDSLNRLMFYAGIYAGSRSDEWLRDHFDNVVQTQDNITGHLQGQHNVYQSNFHWFVAATVVEVVCIALILPTYWGWWNLGRSVSLSPLEVAKAFDAPVLSSCNSNSSGKDVAAIIGNVPIQYGATVVEGGEKLAFADPALVEEPQRNSRFNI